MTSRENTLERIRQNKSEEKPLPESFSIQSITLSDSQLTLRFKESLNKAGAGISEFANEKEALVYLETNFHDPVNLCNSKTSIKYLGISNEELGKTEVVILEGQFGVAENGAIWVDEANIPNRLLPFVTRHLVIVLNRMKIVNNMHDAYKKVDMAGISFGAFISGPSKTADIEQSLVYGAHGAKQLFVIMY